METLFYTLLSIRCFCPHQIPLPTNKKEEKTIAAVIYYKKLNILSALINIYLNFKISTSSSQTIPFQFLYFLSRPNCVGQTSAKSFWSVDTLQCSVYQHQSMYLLHPPSAVSRLWGWREVAEPGAWGRHPTSPSSTFHLTLVANSPSNIQHLPRQTDICPSHGLQIDKWISLFTWIYVLIDRYRNLPFSFIFYLRVGTNRWAVGPI